MQFSNWELNLFCEQFVDNQSGGLLDKTAKVHNNFICKFVFNDGPIENIYLLDKRTIANKNIPPLLINLEALGKKYKVNYFNLLW